MKKIPVDNLLFNIYKLTEKNKFGPGDLFKVRMELENNLPDTYFDVTRDSLYTQSMIYGRDIIDYDYESGVVSIGNISDYMIKNSNDAECISGEFYEDYKKVLINVINTFYSL